MRFPAARMYSVEITNTDTFEEVEVRDMKAKVAFTPLGRRAGRVFHIGVVTEVREINDQTVLARIADGKGAFTVMAHEVYQAQPYTVLKEIEPPCVVAVVGKIKKRGDYRAFVRPEFVGIVSEKERAIWENETEESTRKLIEKIESDEEYAKKVREAYPNVDDIIARIKGEAEREESAEEGSEDEEEDYSYLERALDDDIEFEVEEIDFTKFM